MPHTVKSARQVNARLDAAGCEERTGRRVALWRRGEEGKDGWMGGLSPEPALDICWPRNDFGRRSGPSPRTTTTSRALSLSLETITSGQQRGDEQQQQQQQPRCHRRRPCRSSSFGSTRPRSTRSRSSSPRSNRSRPREAAVAAAHGLGLDRRSSALAMLTAGSLSRTWPADARWPSGGRTTTASWASSSSPAGASSRLSNVERPLSTRRLA